MLFVAAGRRQASLDGFWETLSEEQLGGVEAVAMDMWDPYVASTREHLKESDKKIVYDKYHIAAHLAKAVDQVRRAENKRLRAAGDKRLSGTKYAWLRHPANFSEEAWREFRALRESDLKTARAWALNETAMRLFDYRRESAARAFFEQWLGWARRIRLTPMLAVARMLAARLDNILTYLKHRITNAVSEGLNSRIQWVKATARGFPQSTELHQRHLLPLRRTRYGPQPLKTRKSHFCYGPVTCSPSQGWLCRLASSASFPPHGCNPSYGALTFTPMGLSPTEHASLRWTHVGSGTGAVARQDAGLAVSGVAPFVPV